MLKQGTRSDLGKHQIRILDAVQDGDIHIHKKTIRSLNMCGLVLAGGIRRCVREGGQFQHLDIPWQAIHLLNSGDDQIQAGGVDFLLHTAVDPHAYDLDAEFVGLHIHKQKIIGQQENGQNDDQDLDAA
jgi:hypothetical protein